MPPEDQNHDRPENVTTWLVIPYFDNDLGRAGIDRPVPAGMGVSWLCRSIIVDGTPGGTSFRRGVPLSVELEVANWGAGTLPAVALVRLWWTDPTLAFSTATKFAQTSVVVPPGGAPVRTGVFHVTIPVGVSPHVCLLAQISAPIDSASGVPNPHADRHWAQLNLVEAVTVTAAGKADLSVFLGNPYASPLLSTVMIEPMSRELASLLGQRRGEDVITSNGAEIKVMADDEVLEESIELRPFSVRRVDISIRPSNPPRVGAPQGYVLTQHLNNADRPGEPLLTGTLGVILFKE